MPLDDLHVIPCRIGADKLLNQYLMAGDDAWLWIDSGISSTPDDELLPYVEREQLRPPPRQLAIVTHADVDHFGGLHALRTALPSLVVLAHRRDVPWIENHDRLVAERYAVHRGDGIVPTPAREAELRQRAGLQTAVDLHAAGGERLGPDGSWTALHLPGHSRGHLGLWERERRRAIIGDAVLGWGLRAITGGLVAAPAYYDVPAYLATIDRLESLALAELHTSHFPLLCGEEIRDFLAESRAAVAAIGEAMRAALEDIGLATLPELCAYVASDLGRWPEEAWESLGDPLSAHLAEAIVRADVEQRRTEEAIRYGFVRR